MISLAPSFAVAAARCAVGSGAGSAAAGFGGDWEALAAERQWSPPPPPAAAGAHGAKEGAAAVRAAADAPAGRA